jgi:NAD(P)-dependent dehydrogenase (short-subunit alcohol dehydrogenase family)
MTKTWFITGASRGLGADIAHAALRNGDRVVATGRSRDSVAHAVGPDSEHVLTAALDVTDSGQAEAATAAAVTRFGGIDVLVNNAGYGHLGLFEETTEQDAEAQFATNFFGALKVTRAVLPFMRAARHGHIFNLSSIAGVRGSEGGSLYCSSKFALEGFSESLAKEVAPFGVFVTIVEPGFFRTEFLSGQSVRFGGQEIADYADRSGKLRLAGTEAPPLRFAAGADAVGVVETKLAGVRAELDAWRELSVSLSGDYRK